MRMAPLAPLARRAILAGAAAAVLALSHGAAMAQIAPPRTLDELKAETQARADRNAYPLTGLKADDVRRALAAISSLDRDEWAKAWGDVAGQYMEQARAAELIGKSKNAHELYLMAWRLYSFARWPTPNSPGKQRAYELSLDAFQHYASHLDPAPTLVRIPFEGKEIVGWLRLPKGAQAAPLVLTISALDSRKEDNVERGEVFVRRGIATFSFDMPGTGQAPLKGDVDSERMFSRVLDYVATRPELDAKRVVVQGGSWSGYWAAKLAVTERTRLRGCVMHGGPIHHYFQPDWLMRSLETGEYLYDYLEAKCAMFGATNLEEMIERARAFSLHDSGLLDEPSAPMLLVNGARDSQIPIGDLFLLLEHGSAKEAWVNPAGGHMGRSPEWPSSRIADEVLLPWIARIVS